MNLLNLKRMNQNMDFIQELNDSNICNDFDLLISTRDNDIKYKGKKNVLSVYWLKFNTSDISSKYYLTILPRLT